MGSASADARRTRLETVLQPLSSYQNQIADCCENSGQLWMWYDRMIAGEPCEAGDRPTGCCERCERPYETMRRYADQWEPALFKLRTPYPEAALILLAEPTCTQPCGYLVRVMQKQIRLDLPFREAVYFKLKDWLKETPCQSGCEDHVSSLNTARGLMKRNTTHFRAWLQSSSM